MVAVNHGQVRNWNHGQSLFLSAAIGTASAVWHALIYLVDYFDIFDRQYALGLFLIIESTICHNRGCLYRTHDRWLPFYGTICTNNVENPFSSAFLADEVVDLNPGNLDNCLRARIALITVGLSGLWLSSICSAALLFYPIPMQLSQSVWLAKGEYRRIEKN